MNPAVVECVVLLLVVVDLSCQTVQVLVDSGILKTKDDFICNNSILAVTKVVKVPNATAYHFCIVLNSIFAIESSIRIFCCHRTIVLRWLRFLNIFDGLLTVSLFSLRVILLCLNVNPFVRDAAGFLIAFRLLRSVTLLKGLTVEEKSHLLLEMERKRREETFNKEQVDIVQSKVDNYEREILELKAIIKTATLIRKNSNNNLVDADNLPVTGEILNRADEEKCGKRDSGHYDSGNSSDTAQECPYTLEDEGSIYDSYPAILPNSISATDNLPDSKIGRVNFAFNHADEEITEEEMQIVREVVNQSAIRKSNNELSETVPVTDL